MLFIIGWFCDNVLKSENCQLNSLCHQEQMMDNGGDGQRTIRNHKSSPGKLEINSTHLTGLPHWLHTGILPVSPCFIEASPFLPLVPPRPEDVAPNWPCCGCAPDGRALGGCHLCPLTWALGTATGAGGTWRGCQAGAWAGAGAGTAVIKISSWNFAVLQVIDVSDYEVLNHFFCPIILQSKGHFMNRDKFITSWASRLLLLIRVAHSGHQANTILLEAILVAWRHEPVWCMLRKKSGNDKWLQANQKDQMI
jgi:hypothetical protein